MKHTELVQRLQEHFKTYRGWHQNRARTAGARVVLVTFDEVLTNISFFDYCCPFCGRSLADVELNFCHIKFPEDSDSGKTGITASGHTSANVFFSCADCNQTLWNKHGDNVNAFLSELGLDSDLWWRRALGVHRMLTAGDMAVMIAERLEKTLDDNS